MSKSEIFVNDQQQEADIVPSARSRVILSQNVVKARRSRNIALGCLVGFLALLFYAMTVVKIAHFGFVPNASFESTVQ